MKFSKLALLAMVVGAVALTACNKQEAPAETPKAENTQTTEVAKEAEKAAAEVAPAEAPKAEEPKAEEKANEATATAEAPKDGETAEKKAGENQQY